MLAKTEMRRIMRKQRAEFVAGLPPTVRALVLNRPPKAIADRLGAPATLGCYQASPDEAPCSGWARWFHEQGWLIALPRATSKAEPIDFRLWENPWDDSPLEPGLAGIAQPPADAPPAQPDAVIVPLLAFTRNCDRLGQGAGHYDRWLAEHPGIPAIGLAWDNQLVEALALESHDRRLTAVVTPTQIYWSAG